jgi:hypothetical protein
MEFASVHTAKQWRDGMLSTFLYRLGQADHGGRHSKVTDCRIGGMEEERETERITGEMRKRDEGDNEETIRTKRKRERKEKERKR